MSFVTRDNQEGEEVTVVDQLHIIGKLCFSQRLTPQPFPHALHGKRHIFQESSMQSAMLELKAVLFLSLKNFRSNKVIWNELILFNSRPIIDILSRYLVL